MKVNNIEQMSKQEKIQMLQTIATGKQTIAQILSKLLPEKIMVVRKQPEGFYYKEKLYTLAELNAVIKQNKKSFNLVIIWVKREKRTSSISN